MKLSTAVALIGLCLIPAGVAMADVTTATHTTYALRPCSTCKEVKYDTESECREAAQAEARRVGETRTTGSAVYTCISRHNVIASFRAAPAPVTCPPAPASQTRTVACPAGTTGTYTEQSSSAVSEPPECIVTTTWTAIPPGNGACVPVSQPPVNALFSDRFEYEIIPRAGNADLLKQRGGYTHVKAQNSGTNSGGSGYIYTQFNEALGSRVLVLESRPTMHPAPAGFPYSQTDYYLQLGREGSTVEVLPANVWIQFWTYATPDSRFSTRDKTIYPCNSYYPCNWGPNLGWLFMWGSGGFNAPGDNSSRRFLALEAQNADNRGADEYPTNKAKLGQNVNATPLAGGRWYQVRLHMDTSGAQGTYEAWVRQIGQTNWTKVSDWRGGVTPNFSWPIPQDQRRGHAMVRIPTTVNASDNTVYIDDLAIGRSQAELPAN